MRSRFWPHCISGWLLAAALVTASAFMVHYCRWCHYRIARNGGYAAAIYNFTHGL